MSSTQTSESVVVERDAYPVPAVIDYLIAAIVVLGGLALVAAGSALTFVVDRAMIVEGVESGAIEANGLTDAELVEVTLSTVTWTGVGLLVTGGLLVVGGVAYAFLRRRTRRRAARGEQVSDFTANAVVGAAASVLLSFVPFSPALGGAIAGYLERGESERTVSVGALSGILAVAPLALVTVFVLAGLTNGILAIGASGIAIVVAVVLLIALMVVATVGAGLGALGGYVGGQFAERSDSE